MTGSLPAGRPLGSLALLAVLAACGRDPKPTPNQEAPMPTHDPSAPAAPSPAPAAPSPAAPSPDAAPAAAPVAARELALTEPTASARLRVKVPTSWQSNAGEIVLRDSFGEAIAGVHATVICNKACGAADVAQIPTVLDQTFEGRARPNVNTGDPAMDAVRLAVAVVEQGDVPDGKFRVARITRPAGLDGPYREQLYAVCIRARPGEKIVSLQAWAPLDRERELGPLITDACKTFEIL